MSTRIGVLGGSFDPFHCGHLALACAARDALSLDAVLVQPAGQPWQRPPLAANPAQRLEMVQLATEGQPKLIADARETMRSGASYTVDTLEELAVEYSSSSLYLILGGDQLQNFTSWHRWERIVQLARLAVAQRAGAPLIVPPELPAEAVVPIDMPAMQVSATQIRERLARGENVSELLPQKLLDYIARHKLYLNLKNLPA